MSEAHMKVRLMQRTECAAEVIALAGKLCYSNSHIDELAEKTAGRAGEFVQRLRGLGHLSPLEHVSFTFGVEGVSRALLAQITRHRIASFSVQSQRYVKQDDFNYIIPDSIKSLGEESQARFDEQMRMITGFYGEWLEQGIPAEDARFVLPNAAETRMLFTMNARELLHFFSLRCCNRAQWEIRALAWTVLGIAMREAPAIFKDAAPGCVSSHCTEGTMSCKKSVSVREFAKELFARSQANASDEEITDFVLAFSHSTSTAQ